MRICKQRIIFYYKLRIFFVKFLLITFGCGIIGNMKSIFIYNPNSGRGKTVKKLPYIVKMLSTKYDTVDVYATKARGDLTEKIREVADSYDCIVFAGGDGSFNEVLRGIGDMDNPPLLGYIPSGTANDVAHSLKIPRKSIRGALRVILDGRSELLDCMKINGTDYAMYSVSAGAFTSTTYTTPQKKKRRFGWLAYGMEGLKKNIPFEVFPVTVSDQEREAQTESVFVLVMNGKCVAGMKMNTSGSMIDGNCEVAVVTQSEKPKLRNHIRAFFALIKLFLFGYKIKEKNLERFHGNKITIQAPENVVWNYDGEKGRSGSIEIEVLRERVRLIVPKNNKNI